MTSYWVSPSGSDSSGDGSYVTPFLTIAKAAAVAAVTPVDVIEVTSGTITETVTLSGPLGFHTIRGRGAQHTTIVLEVAWLEVDSVDAPRLLILDLTLEVTEGEVALVTATASDATAGSVTVARCRILLSGSEDTVLRYVGPDPQTFVPRLYVDFLHCLIDGTAEPSNAFFSGSGSPIDAVAARNCIFTRLAAVNVAQPFDSDANWYWDNQRDLNLGTYGRLDVRAVDPELIAGTVTSLDGSPLEAAGVDLSSGYGWPTRTPSEEINLAFPGTAPTIGVVEPVTPNARTTVTTTDIHTIVQALAGETAVWRSDLDSVHLDRAISTADGMALSRRWGALTGLRFLSGDVEDYRRDLITMLDAVLVHAPTWHALRTLAGLVYPRSRLLRVDDNRRYHFQAGSALKIWADYSGGSPTFDFYLTPGELQLEGRWLNVRRNDFSVATADAVRTLYVSGADPLTGDEDAKVQVSSAAITDETRTQLSGMLTFRTGETRVTASEDLSALVQTHRRIAHGFSSADHVVETVVDARTLELRYPYPGEDHVGLAWVITPNHVFGRVTVDDAMGVIAIDCPGRLGSTTRPYSRAAKAHGYELSVDVDGSALEDASLEARTLFEILGRAHPVHKRGYFRLRDDVRALVLGQPWPYGEQGTFSYREIFDDPAWYA